MSRLVLLVTILTLQALPQLMAQQGKTRNQRVLDDRELVRADDFWIYNDLETAFKHGTETRKPVLVVFRCIPCEACAQLDASIVERDPRVRALMEQYVCVRVVHANGLDLGLFQFDYDQSFAVFLMNGDKTIYGRYGTRSHQTRSADDVSIEGFAESLEAGLKVHAQYPNNKSQLAGKQPRAVAAHRVPEQFPRLKKYASKLDYQGNVAASCIHCHQVGEAIRSELRDEGKPIPTAVLFPYPHPKVLGLRIDPKQKATVVSLSDNSPGTKSGLKPGDELISISGQPILSTADIQWALHNAPESGSIQIDIQRDGQSMQLALELEPGWRTRGDISWRATSWALRRMTIGGLKLEEATADLRQKLQIDDTSMALVVKYMGQHGDNAHAKQQGFKQGDVILSVAGNSERMRETDLVALLINKPVGERIPVKVWRDTKQLDLSLTMQK